MRAFVVGPIDMISSLILRWWATSNLMGNFFVISLHMYIFFVIQHIYSCFISFVIAGCFLSFQGTT
jgi:hypothetical protein